MQSCRGRRSQRGATAVVILAALATATGAEAAPPRPPVEVENLRIGFASGDKPNLFRIGAWTPVWSQLRAGEAGFTGFIETVVPDDEGVPTVFRRRIEVGPRESRTIVTYARPGTIDPEFVIRLLNDRGRRVVPDVSTTALAIKVDPIQIDETLLLTLGKPQGVDQVPGLPGFTNDSLAPGVRGSGEVVAVGGIDLLGGALPGRWYGYDAASAIVLDTNDAQTMNELTSTRGPALAEWVKRGGHLVVAVGANWQAVKDTDLGPLLPAVPAGQERVASLETLDSYAGATKSITPPGAPAVMVTKLEDVEARGGKVLASALGLPVIVRGPVGFGRITLLAFDVDQRPFADWPDRGLFWVRACDLRVRGNANTPAGTVVGGRARFYQPPGNDLAGRLHTALSQFPGVTLIPFGWVAFFIFLYILLIGPGDYFFLKKVLKRMELTWITFPVIVVSVSLMAYFAAYFVKGTDLRVNAANFIDIDQTSDKVMGRGTAVVNIYSPRNHDYDVSILPTPLNHDAPKPASGGSLRPPPGTDLVLSWFGNPEAGFGGMGQSGRMSLSGGRYAYAPVDTAESIEDVRIAIWSTKCFAARWFGPSPAVVASDLQQAGPDRLTGTVTNSLDVPLKDAILAFGKQVYLLGTIAPNATIRVETAQDRFLSGHIRSKEEFFGPGYNSNPDVISLVELMPSIMFHECQAVAGGDSNITSRTLRDLDLTGQVALGRPMLVARIDRPGAQLVLDGTPRPPDRRGKIGHTTMLRVILALDRPEPVKPTTAPAPEPDPARRQP